MNGKKLLVVGLTIVCVASLTGNVYLHMQNKTLTDQLAEQTTKTGELTQQAENYHVQIAELQAQLTELQLSYKMVTDEMDVFSADNIVVDTPQTAETEQSTQGAAQAQQSSTAYTQQQQQAKPTPPPAQSKPTTPPAQSKPTPPPAQSKPTPPASSSVQNPTASDVNDYLNDVLGGGGGGSTSKPNPGSSGGSTGNLGDASNLTGDDVLGGHVDPGELDFK